MKPLLNKRPVYKCSQCKKYGHNARTCTKTSQSFPHQTTKNTHLTLTAPSCTVTEPLGGVNDAWNKLPQEGDTTNRTEPETLQGVVALSSIAEMKRQLRQPDKVLVCLERPDKPEWTGYLLAPTKTTSHDVTGRIVATEANPQSHWVAYFAFPKASTTQYNTDGSFSTRNDGEEGITWAVFNNQKSAENYLNANKDNITARREKLTKKQEEERRKKQAEMERVTEERKQQYAQERARKETEYNKNPNLCQTKTCSNTVPYSNHSRWGDNYCDPCKNIEEQRLKNIQIQQEADKNRLLKQTKNLKSGERVTVIIKGENPKEFSTHTNVRLAFGTHRGVKNIPIFLPPRAQTKGRVIPTDSVVINKSSDIVYSGSRMVEECKNFLTETHGYTEQEAEAYAILISDA